MFVYPRVQEIKAVVKRLREARNRLRLGLTTEPLDDILDEAADLLERSEEDVQARFTFETQVGVSLTGETP